VVEVVFKRWRSCGIYGEHGAPGVPWSGSWGLFSPTLKLVALDAKNNIETAKIHSTKSQMEKNRCWR